MLSRLLTVSSLLVSAGGICAAQEIPNEAVPVLEAKVDGRIPWIAADDMRMLTGCWEMQNVFVDGQTEGLPTDRLRRQREVAELSLSGSQLFTFRIATHIQTPAGRIVGRLSEAVQEIGRW